MATGARRLPTFFLVGASKAGSTAIYEALRWHKQIYLSPIKEVHYFARDIDTSKFKPEYNRGLTDFRRFLASEARGGTAHNAHVTRWEDYIALFRNVQNESAIGEGSTSYLFSSEAARAISEVLPAARIVMVLRDPIERAYSNYLMDLRVGTVRRSFMAELKADLEDHEQAWGLSRLYVSAGLYARQVRRYQEAFPSDQIKIVLWEDLKGSWSSVIKELFAFLGVESNVAPELIRVNEAAVPRFVGLNYAFQQSGLKAWVSRFASAGSKLLVKEMFYAKGRLPRLTEEERRFAAELFRKDILELETLIQRDLSSWLGSKASNPHHCAANRP